ncbi:MULTISPECIES: putative beta-lysine N-acetyltransferase [Prosthecochloris]|nr:MULTISPECIES: putative beta-lysine N-acetyltransferase [Prosthecochloris]ANT65241.1 putative beta-lysine N-acetyltransferase [Prosthecochloris sp. CIB 2401]
MTDMHNDITTTLAGATIQHGKKSNRIYLMKPGSTDLQQLLPDMEELAAEHGYTKIVAKVPDSSQESFLQHGYTEEASIPGFYRGVGKALFLCKYLTPERRNVPDIKTIEEVLELCANAAAQAPEEPRLVPEGINLRTCTQKDAETMSAIYREVFPSYPFPIDDPGYLKETMQSHIDYFGAGTDSNLIALASSEMDLDNLNVEMTDFATLPAARGKGLARHLLGMMEAAMKKRGMRVAYTIARAISTGMNLTFAKAGYTLSGTLWNNTGISGGIESMNVWHKPL